VIIDWRSACHTIRTMTAFLLLDAQFLTRRERPLLIAGPPGTRARLDQSLEVFFPRSTTNKWRFSWKVMEIEVARPTEVLGHCVTTTEVLHYSGAPSTAIVLSDGDKRFAYSGDTEWVDALVSVAAGADLFIVECFAYSGELPGHITWDVLKPRLPDLRARRIMQEKAEALPPMKYFRRTLHRTDRHRFDLSQGDWQIFQSSPLVHQIVFRLRDAIASNHNHVCY
jgi:hypothetical protein